MSYAKSLKKSPFKTLTITLGKRPDGSIWQTAFITQDGDAPSAYFECPFDATAAERKGFLPLVKEALKRAQSIEELTDLLKPSAVGRPAPDIRAGAQWSEEDKSQMQQTSIKVPLLHLLTKHDDPAAAVEAVLNSGLLPEALLRQWLNQLVERAIRRVLGHTGIWEWELWAARWLVAADRTEEAARKAADAAGYGCCDPARSISRVLFWDSKADAVKDLESDSGEIKAQYDDLFNLINEL